MEKKPCAVCRKFGKNGAQWTIEWKGQPTLKVHRPCGANIAKYAPEGVQVTLRPDEELRREFQAQARERQARSFWESKGLSKEAFRNAKATTARAKAV